MWAKIVGMSMTVTCRKTYKQLYQDIKVTVKGLI